MNGVAALGGYLLYPAAVEAAAAWTAFGGTALLAAGGSALNQVMERERDRLMERTRRRPVAGGDLSPGTAAGAGGLLICAGLLWLGCLDSAVPLLLAGGALVWYLAVYTPLKGRTSLALPLGALCGALPPLIGWCLAGGAATDHRILLVAGVMFLWQIPHFWLLQQRYRDEYRTARLPICDISRQARHAPLLPLWVTALAAAALFLPLFSVISPSRALWFMPLVLLLPVLTALRSDRLLFATLNLFPLLLTLSIWP
ncbi:protoheme IX farnesyltransferase [Trichlorobacter ammonificans]|nr:UbiA family prenyltransferase [Trichlorobacter ammonificans]